MGSNMLQVDSDMTALDKRTPAAQELLACLLVWRNPPAVGTHTETL